MTNTTLTAVDEARTAILTGTEGNIIDAIEGARAVASLASAVAIIDPLLADSRAKIKMHGRTFSLESVVRMPARVRDNMPPVFMQETIAVYGLAAFENMLATECAK